MKKFLIICVLLLSGLLGFVVSWYQHKKPMGLPVIETFHSPALFVEQLKGDKQAGEKIFHEFCSVCHAKNPQIEVSAPRITDKKIWRALTNQGLPSLLQKTINGGGAMPARGGCFECSDEQLLEAIKYMVR